MATPAPEIRKIRAVFYSSTGKYASGSGRLVRFSPVEPENRVPIPDANLPNLDIFSGNLQRIPYSLKNVV